MKQEIIEKTYHLVDEIKNTNDYKRLLELKAIINNNKDIQSMVQTFQKLQKKYEEVTKYGKYHPDLKQVQKSFSDAKENLYMNEIVKEYKEKERKVQKVLNHISKELAVCVSTKVKHPNELGLVNKH